MTRWCGRCNEQKPVSEFHRRRKYGWQAWCKTCRRAYDHEYHLRTRAVRIAQKRRYREEMRVWYRDLKSDRPCADCGCVFHYAAMEWDHRPGTVKTDLVSRLVLTNSRRRVLEEIAKCDLVCANCHAVRTFERLIGA